MTAPALIGVFDAGAGGVPIAAALQARGHKLVYVADAARRPYGPQANDVVADYVAEAEQFFAAAGCDAWVVACHTASVVAERALRHCIPCVSMVGAVVHAFPPSGAGPLGVFGTAGTVASNAYPEVLSTYRLHQVATEELLRIAEEGGSDAAQVRELTSQALQELRQEGCREVLLACTDFTCVLDDMAAVADGMRLVDPMDSALALLDEALVTCDRRGPSDHRDRLVLTGPHPLDIRAYARDRFGLHLPAIEYLELART